MSLSLSSESDEELADEDNVEVNLDDVADDGQVLQLIAPKKVCAQNTCIA
jgi:hypothetical protein